MKALAARLEHSAVGFEGKGNGQRSTFDARGDGGTREGVAMSGGAPGGIFPAMVSLPSALLCGGGSVATLRVPAGSMARPKTEFRKSRSSKKLNNMEKANEEMRVYLEQHKIEEVFVS